MLASGQRLSVIGPDELGRSCGSRPIIKFTFVQFVWNENLRSAWSPEGWRQTELGRVPDAQILFPQALKWANGAGPSRHFASQRKRSIRPRRSPHAFDSQEIGLQREEHLPCLGGVGRQTHDLCCERKRRHREALRHHFGVGGLGTFFPECRFYNQHLPSGQEGGAVAVNVRARLPSPGPSQLSDSSSRRKRHCTGAPSLNLNRRAYAGARMAEFDLVRKCVILANRRRLATRKFDVGVFTQPGPNSDTSKMRWHRREAQWPLRWSAFSHQALQSTAARATQQFCPRGSEFRRSQ
jgi:hypothetical protein